MLGPRLKSDLVKTALASVPQALPQLVLAQQVSGTHLMEVVIRGDLVRAVDGRGWRAFSIGQNGIEQHARLFEVGGLQALAAGVMVWQLASILFGQKHLHDINRQLVGINQKLDSILGMLRSERRATILAGWRYVKDAVHAAERGELSDATRQQLESVEYQLTVALYAIRAEFDEVRRRPLARGKIGTAQEFESLKRNLGEYRALFEDMSACIEVRQACCYAASLYPGGRILLGKRLQGLHDDVEVFSTAGRETTAETERRVGEITSVWNRDATLTQRREGIFETLRDFTDSVADNTKRHEARGKRIEVAFSSLDELKTLYVTVNNGKVVDVHESLTARS